jgi:hypothetical protein
VSDLHLRLLREATSAHEPRAFWAAAAQAIREWTGASAVTIDYAGAGAGGTAQAGGPTGAPPDQTLTWVDDDGRRVTLRAVGTRPDLTPDTLSAALDGASRLAEMVSRRAALERDRRLGTFLVELSRWLMAAPESDVLLRYTLQSVMALVEGHGAYVALRQAGDGVLRVVTALGDAGPRRGAALKVEGRTTRSGGPNGGAGI